MVTLSAVASELSRTYELEIPPSSLESALLKFAVQTGVSVVFQHSIVEGQNFDGLSGSFEFEAALKKLLEGAPLQYEFLSGATLVITRISSDGVAGGAEPAGPATAPAPHQGEAKEGNVSEAGKDGDNDSGRYPRVADRLEEVQVTARRREESMQTTPISMTVLMAPAIERLELQDLSQIYRFVPNMSFNTGASPSTSQIFIRGVGQWDTLLTTDPGVGIYMDGVYLARAFGNSLDLLELQRVEVLRGPQGTLYGKNTTGGAINVITKKPAENFAAWGKGTIGRYDRLEFQGSIDLPLSDSVKTKYSLSTKKQDGYGLRLGTGEDQGNTDNTYGRAQLTWTANDRFNLYLSLDGAREDERTIDGVLASVDPFALAPFLAHAIVRPDLEPLDAYVTDTYYDNYADFGASELRTWGLSATMEWQANDNLTVKSITAYRESDHLFGGDIDESPLPIFSIVFDSEQDQFSQELQFLGESMDDRLNWILGAYYFHEDTTSQDPIGLIPGLYTALENLPGPLPVLGIGGPGNPANLAFDLSLDLFNTMDVNSMALFGQGTLSVNDQMSITGGLRYTYESKDYFFSSVHPESGTVAIPPTSLSNDWPNLLGRLGLEYQWRDDLMTYASISTGFKSGGFNGRPQVIEELTSYDEEKVITYEMGLKSTWREDTLRLNGALFYTDYRDLQLTSVVETETGFLSLVENAGRAQIIGGELELAWLPVENLQINVGVGYLHDRIRELDPDVQSVTLDSDLPRTPNWTLNASADYRRDLFGGTLFVGIDWHYEGAQAAIPSTDPNATVPGYQVTGLSITWAAPGDRWELALWSTNLFDEKYLVARTPATNFSGYTTQRYGRPMEWAVSLRFNHW